MRLSRALGPGPGINVGRDAMNDCVVLNTGERERAALLWDCHMHEIASDGPISR